MLFEDEVDERLASGFIHVAGGSFFVEKDQGCISNLKSVFRQKYLHCRGLAYGWWKNSGFVGAVPAKNVAIATYACPLLN